MAWHDSAIDFSNEILQLCNMNQQETYIQACYLSNEQATASYYYFQIITQVLCETKCYFCIQSLQVHIADVVPFLSSLVCLKNSSMAPFPESFFSIMCDAKWDLTVSFSATVHCLRSVILRVFFISGTLLVAEILHSFGILLTNIGCLTAGSTSFSSPPHVSLSLLLASTSLVSSTT